MRHKVEGDSSFVKDTKSKAVLNVNNSALEAYKKQRAVLSKASTASDEINNLKEEVQEIKEMLKQLLSKV